MPLHQWFLPLSTVVPGRLFYLPETTQEIPMDKPSVSSPPAVLPLLLRHPSAVLLPEPRFPLLLPRFLSRFRFPVRPAVLPVASPRQLPFRFPVSLSRFLVFPFRFPVFPFHFPVFLFRFPVLPSPARLLLPSG